MQVRVETSHKRLEASGSVVVADVGMTLSIHIDDVELEIAFTGDGDEPGVEGPIVSPKKFAVTLTNWTNPLGTSWYLPNLVDADGLDVDLALTVHGIGHGRDLARIVSYSVYSSLRNG